jgi:hypothetical protein
MMGAGIEGVMDEGSAVEGMMHAGSVVDDGSVSSVSIDNKPLSDEAPLSSSGSQARSLHSALPESHCQKQIYLTFMGRLTESGMAILRDGILHRCKPLVVKLRPCSHCLQIGGVRKDAASTILSLARKTETSGRVLTFSGKPPLSQTPPAPPQEL